MVAGADKSRIVAGGSARGGQGYFFEPTVLVDLPPDHELMREEIFGPIIAINSFNDVEEAITAANDTPYGLAAQVWTRDIGAAHSIASRIRAGTIWINCSLESDFSMPFGGYGQSGIGREHGPEGLDAFLETKAVFARL
jgi:phenylacetaldehyde dehydrogenase